MKYKCLPYILKDADAELSSGMIKKTSKINQNGVSFAEEIGFQRAERRQDAPWIENDPCKALKSKLE